MDVREKHKIHSQKYAYNLLNKLLDNRDTYFDRFNRLNSDGMRILRSLNRSLMESQAISPKIVKKIWKNPTYEYLREIKSRLDNQK
jgi:hypothetical protein